MYEINRSNQCFISESALEYFHSLNIFLCFPRSLVLSEIVFTDPQQVVVTIVSAFVKEAYQKVTDTEIKNFSRRGEFTKSFVKSKLGRFLVPAAGFEEAKVIELSKITLVIAHIEKGQYFMPCVLLHCSLDEFEKERETLKVPPVILELPGDTQLCSTWILVCGLMQKWKLRKRQGKITDIFKNFVQFTVDGYRVVVADTSIMLRFMYMATIPTDTYAGRYMKTLLKQSRWLSTHTTTMMRLRHLIVWIFCACIQDHHAFIWLLLLSQM